MLLTRVFEELRKFRSTTSTSTAGTATTSEEKEELNAEKGDTCLISRCMNILREGLSRRGATHKLSLGAAGSDHAAVDVVVRYSYSSPYRGYTNTYGHNTYSSVATCYDTSNGSITLRVNPYTTLFQLKYVLASDLDFARTSKLNRIEM